MTRTRPAVLATVTVAALALAGCGVEVVPDAPATRTSAPTSSSTGGQTPGPSSPEAAGHGSYAGWAAEIREASQRQVRCDGTPVTLDTPSLTVELTGRCGTVTVSAVGVTALAEDIGSLVVTGNQAFVATRTVGSVAVSGQGGEVVWVDGDPTIGATRSDTVAVRIPEQP